MPRQPITPTKTALALVMGLGLLSAAPAWAQELTVVSFGGSYQEGQSKALFQPAAKALSLIHI